ncbi:MAG: SpoIIE family protein phosphatase [Coriobacteriia bacterium]|nr:SpoIIE family protein phosphatase [Coriobacteriia bacterium]
MPVARIIVLLCAVVALAAGGVAAVVLVGAWRTPLSADAIAMLGGACVTFGALTVAVVLWLVFRRDIRLLFLLTRIARHLVEGSHGGSLPDDAGTRLKPLVDAFGAVATKLSALRNLSRTLGAAERADQALDAVLEAVDEMAGPVSASAAYLADGGGRWLVLSSDHGIGVTGTPLIDALGDSWLAKAQTSACSAAYAAGEGTIAEELPGWDLLLPSAVLVTPLTNAHEVLGVVVVARGIGRPFSEAERELVGLFCAQAGVVIGNSRRLATEEEMCRVSEGLRMAAESLARPGGLGPALTEVGGVIADLFCAEKVRFAFNDRAVLGLEPAEDCSSEQALLEMARTAFGRLGTGRPAVVHQAVDGDENTVFERSDVRELLLVPVDFESTRGAVLAIERAGQVVGQRDVELAQALSNELVLALDNAYLYERAVARADKLETIFNISQAVGSSLQVNVVLNRVLDVVQRILSADAVALMTYDARTRVITTAMARGAVPPEFVDLRLSPGEDVPGYVISTGEPVSFWDLHETLDGIAGTAAAHGLHSLLAVPLLARGRSIGVLVVLSREPAAFAEEDHSMLQTFASQAALALDTARLYSREHDVAEVLQRSILPGTLPPDPEFDFAAAYQPAGTEAEIGGDYYDLFRAPDGQLWFAIADVCGKGVHAATKTSMIKYSVRALVSAGLSVSAVVERVNRLVTESGEPSDIVTLWLGRLDPATGRLTWANGGHPPGLIGRKAGGIESLSSTGPLLGAGMESQYGEYSVGVLPGDVVLLYTDGVTEARRNTAFFGEMRIREVLDTQCTPEDVVSGILSAVRRFSHGELRDDIAVLAIAMRGRSIVPRGAHEGGDSNGPVRR